MSSNQLKYESLNSDRLLKVITRHIATEILTAELNSSSKNIFAVSILRQVCKVDKQKILIILAKHSRTSLEKERCLENRGQNNTLYTSKTKQQNCQTAVTSFSKLSCTPTKF